MTSTEAPQYVPIDRKPLDATTLPLRLKTMKTVQYPDPTTTTSSRSNRGNNLSSHNSPAPILRALAWNCTGGSIATAENRTIRVWHSERPSLRHSLELKLPSSSSSNASAAAHLGRRPPPSAAPTTVSATEAVAWAPGRDGEVASVGGDGVVRFWDVRARTLCSGSVEVGGEGLSLCWRPEGGGSVGAGDEIVVGRKDDRFIGLSRRTMSIISTHKQPFQTNAIAFTNSGKQLLVTSTDDKLKIFDYPSMTTKLTLAAHTSATTTTTHSPSGRHIAIGGSDALVTLWDTATLTCRHSYSTLCTGPVRSVSISWDGAYLCAGGEDSSSSSRGAGVEVASTETGEVVGSASTNLGTGVGLSGGSGGSGAGGAGGAGPSPMIVAWHPSRYVLAFGGGDVQGLRVAGWSER